jgi:predicted transcriptional regulator YdeE
MSFEIILLPAMMIMGVELRTTYQNNECFSAIPAFWQQQQQNNPFAKIPNKVSPDIILGLYTNYTPDFSFTSGYYSLVLGCPVTYAATIPAGMVVKEIPATKYAVFTAHGPFASAIEKTWMDIWQDRSFERTFTSDFEWYDSKSTNDVDSEVKIYIAIK